MDQKQQKKRELAKIGKRQGKAKTWSFEMRKHGPQRHGQWLDAIRKKIATAQEEAERDRCQQKIRALRNVASSFRGCKCFMQIAKVAEMQLPK